MGIGAKNNQSRAPPPPRQPGQPSAPPPGTNHSNAPFPPRGGSQHPSKGQQATDRLYLCLPFVKAALVKGNFKTIVALPKCSYPIARSTGKSLADHLYIVDVDVNEWVAVNRESALPFFS